METYWVCIQILSIGLGDTGCQQLIPKKSVIRYPSATFLAQLISLISSYVTNWISREVHQGLKLEGQAHGSQNLNGPNYHLVGFGG